MIYFISMILLNQKNEGENNLNNKKSLLITLSIFIILCILSIFAKTAFQSSDTEEATDSTIATKTTAENKYQESDDFDWDWSSTIAPAAVENTIINA